MDPIIKVENLSKQYRLGNIGTGTLSHDLNRWWYKVRGKEDPYLMVGEVNDRSVKGSSDYVWALKDIDFHVEPGEVLGIVGKNGAGKSTLLKLLSRVTAPTTGKITAHGRIASLLEVGTGFHPELTGRENVFLNGAIMGMSKLEIKGKFDEIVDFAGCERYIDTPVKRYSSGMYVRLAFAVAAHLEPDILIVDEVLAVGDAEFQKKAIGKMQDVSSADGRTVLFVSHNMTSVKTLCSRGLMLANGQIVYEGSAVDTVDYYLKDNRTDLPSRKWEGEGLPLDDKIKLLSIKAHSADGSEIIFPTDKDLFLDLKISKENTADCRYDFTFQIKDNKDQVLFPVASSIVAEVVPSEQGHFRLRCLFPKNLFNTGDLYLNLFLLRNKNQLVKVVENIISINYSPPQLDVGDYTQKVEGFLRPRFSWDIQHMSSDNYSKPK